MVFPPYLYTEFKSSYEDIECDELILMINGSFSSDRPLDVIKATIQYVPNLGHGIMNSSCNVQC